LEYLVVVVLVLIIGINNLLLGYALGVWLGYGPSTGMATEWILSLWPFGPDAASAAATSQTGQSDPAGQAALAAASTAATPSTVASVAEKRMEMLVFGLNQAVLRSVAKVTEIDTRLRAMQGRYEAPSLQQCAKELLADCETYLSKQRQATESFRERAEELGAQGNLAEQIELANLEVSAQIETAISHLQDMDVESDPAAAAERLLAEIYALHAAQHRLRDGQERAFLTIAREAGRLATLDDRLKTDPLTGLPSRVGLEATLDDWASQDVAEPQPLSAALIDVDGFGQLNLVYGSQAGDRVLRHVGQCLAGAGELVGRYAGQRFLVLVREADPAGLVESLERAGQAIADMAVKPGEPSIEATVTAVIATAAADEVPAALFHRLGQTLAEIRTNGPNQTVLCTPDGPQPVGAEIKC
jgi:diguanylate cyclase (GGDEF)-like protein